jgi:putative transposase
MRSNGIRGAKRRGKPWRTTISDPSAARPPDLVQRDFTASRPNELWCADFTYLRCWEGRVFFAFVIDVYSRMIVGWQFADHVRAAAVARGLKTEDAAGESVSRRRWRCGGSATLAA